MSYPSESVGNDTSWLSPGGKVLSVLAAMPGIERANALWAGTGTQILANKGNNQGDSQRNLQMVDREAPRVVLKSWNWYMVDQWSNT